MSKKFGLGKGLSALIPEEVSKNINGNNDKNKDGVALIDINLIKNNNEQPRKLFDDEKILELAESIKHNGIIQPIILRKLDNKYVIVAGERRWRAAKLIGIKEVPSIVMDLTDKQVMEISLIENIQRQDLNSIEEANAYKNLISEFNMTHDELSKRLGKSRTTITNTMRLLNLSEGVKQYLIEGVISEGHGRVLLSINDDKLQCEVAQKVIDDKLSVRELEKFIKDCKQKKIVNTDKKEIEDKLNPYYKDITEKLQGYLGTKVTISNKKNKGKIEIEYYSYEDLQRRLDIIKL
ncbi:MAG: ParB/RepB/Spo0J family partition protein [Clostridium sp.]|nr:ParB/RepB/Spo0J family partition protein [Clostridium sp.]